ncbi:acyloxyacyl hydrolase [Aquisalimonas asiatica]|uniref:Lipid A 3-O-deacylase (PagL) n=1 Tax=Aquisalimonas asiatica TaxID=406100 RepID=A0A1H8V6M0_9GAMM|nr:acyloxyacyl hydrolase [Aquisalimonas asiatica]SEP11021.1 Lipid A 3-O-deacylase (PagL) [Aquisalimonas asiatica]
MHRFSTSMPAFPMAGAALAALLLLVPGSAWSAGEIGVRAGAGIGGHDYNYQEIYWRPAALAPRFGDRSRWHVAGYTEFNAARVSASGDSMYTSGVGVGGWLTHPARPLSIGVGTGPTYISERRLGGREFGGNWQFTSHAAVRLRVADQVSIGYRIQHTSNAGLYSPNDGYDIQALEVRVGF